MLAVDFGKRALACWTLLLCACGGTPPPQTVTGSATEADLSVQYPDLYDQISASGHFSAGRPHSFKFAPNGQQLYYLRPGDDGQQALYVLDIESKHESLVASVTTLLGGAEVQLSADEKARHERLRQRAHGITRFVLSEDGDTLMIPVSGQVFVVRGSKPARRLNIDGHVIDARLSPDARKVAYVKGADLFVFDLNQGRERRVVKAGKGDIRCGVPEFVAQEEMHRYQGFWWSPDSEKIAYQCNDETGVEALYVQDPASPEEPAAVLRYPRAGTPNVSVRLFIHDLHRRRSSEFSLGDGAEYLVDVRWSADSRPLPIVQDRAQQRMWMIGCGASKDPLSICPMEPITHGAWINIDAVLPLRHEKLWVWSLDEKAGRVVHMREAGAQEVVTLVPASAGYRHALDIEDGFFYFLGGPEPSESHIYRVAFKGGDKVEQLSTGAGVHTASVGPGGLWVKRSALIDGTLSLALYRDDKKLLDLPYDPPLAPFVPSVEVTSIGERDYRTAIVRPRNFDAKLRYPVIVSVYGGPITTVVHNSPRFYFMDQWLADQGFVVIKIDGRGTPHRGDDWEKVTRGDLITVPLQDHVDALRALDERYPELDLERVGIQGWSFGGYFATMAVMLRPDMFKAAIAGAPVTDWRDYDTHYTERYMGLPGENKEGYDRTSALTHAAKLERPLMLVHGMADDNVLYTHTAKLADALVREGKDFELVPLVSATHMGSSGAKRRALQFRYVRFFKRHLGGPVSPVNLHPAP